jgi:hypothetical protein
LFGGIAGLLFLFTMGCGGGPSKSEVEKRVLANLPAASADWKDIRFETRANDTVYVVLAKRAVSGKTFEYSCTCGSSTDGAGVAVRDAAGKWLAKYRYAKGQEVESEKMNGTDEDVKTLRPTAAEIASVVMKAAGK